MDYFKAEKIYFSVYMKEINENKEKIGELLAIALEQSS